MGEKIKLTFLGSGSAIPTKKRNHPAVFLEYKNEGLLFDCGEGTQRQFRIAKINLCKVTKIFISHWHGDHILGLPGLIQTLAISNYNKKLEIYGPTETKNLFELNLLEPLMKKSNVKTEVYDLKEEKIDFGDFEISSLKMEHDCNCLAYNFKVKDKIRFYKDKIEKLGIKDKLLLKKLKNREEVLIKGKKVDGKKITYIEKGKKISYITDTRRNKNIYEIAKNSDLMICESTYSSKNKEIAKKNFHMTAEEAAKEAKKARVKRLILFHLSQRYESNEEEIIKEAKKFFKNTEIAKDFMRVII